MLQNDMVESSPLRDPQINFAYLDERTKRMIRRAILKAVAIPGYQVPFGSREMPLPYGWGTGGIQVTASILVSLMCLRSLTKALTTRSMPSTLGVFSREPPALR